MRLIANLLFRLRAVIYWGKMREELDEEMAFHIEQETAKHMRQGMSATQARHQALSKFGSVLRARERAQDSWGVGLVQDLSVDARHSVRRLLRSTSFTAIVLLTLSLGIGGTTAIFSVVNSVLLRPLPFPDSHELVAVHHTMPGIGVPETPLSPALYLTFRDHSRTVEDIGVWRWAPVTVTGLAEPEQVAALQVTDGLFPLLGVHPSLGRGYSAEDVAPKSSYPVILSRGYWARRFGSDPAVLGRTIRIDGADRTVIGVMPAGFKLAGLSPDLFLPLVLDRASVSVGNWSFPGIARLRPGFTVEDATRDLESMTALASEEYGGIPLSVLESREFGTFVRPLKDDVVGAAGRVIWVVFGTVALVLLVACTNVANLFLVRAESRQRDVALRTALGASKGRLARQFLTESLLIGLLGGAAGLVLATGGLRLLLHLAPANLPRLEDVALEPVALLFTLAVSVLAGLLFGSIPVMSYGRSGLVEPLKEAGRNSSIGRRRFRMQTVFAVAQVALVLVLLIGSGLMIRSFLGLRSVPPGFQRPQEVLTLRLSVPASEAPTGADAARTHQQILEHIVQIPGVTSASAAASVAMDNWDSWEDLEVEGFPVTEGEVEPLRRMNWITPGYFTTIENPILAGRSLEWTDIFEQRPVAVVTENYAREYWGDPSKAIGGRIRENRSAPWREIVGVVGDVHVTGVAEDPPSVVYWPMYMDRFWSIQDYVMRDLRYAIRTSLRNPRGLLPQIREAVWSVNSDLPVSQVMTLDEILAASLSRTSFTLVMLGIAAAVALILGMVGVYGVISYTVAQRTREMGIRLALGARREDVRGLVLRQGGVVGAAGLAIGLVAAVGFTHLIAALLFGVGPVDLATYGAVSLLLLSVVLLASYLPARRAAAVDPMEALRWE
jgi:predicted permease